MFNKHNIGKDSKIVIARMGAASKLVLKYTYEYTFVPPHMYHTKNCSKASNVNKYRSTSLHSRPFWMA